MREWSRHETCGQSIFTGVVQNVLPADTDASARPSRVQGRNDGCIRAVVTRCAMEADDADSSARVAHTCARWASVTANRGCHGAWLRAALESSLTSAQRLLKRCEAPEVQSAFVVDDGGAVGTGTVALLWHGGKAAHRLAALGAVNELLTSESDLTRALLRCRRIWCGACGQ